MFALCFGVAAGRRVRAAFEKRKTERLTLRDVTFGDRPRQRAHPPDVTLSLGHADGSARVEHIELVRGFHDEIVGRKHELVLGRDRGKEALHFPLVARERFEMRGGIGLLEVVSGPLPFRALVDLAVRDPFAVREVEHALHVLQVHGDAFHAVGELPGNGPAVDAADLLKIRELADLLSVEPNLPPQTPRTERGRLPVVFEEAQVVGQRIGAEGAQRLEIEILDVDRRRFEDDLKLVKLLRAVGILAVSSVGRTSGRFDERGVPGFGAESA